MGDAHPFSLSGHIQIIYEEYIKDGTDILNCEQSLYVSFIMLRTWDFILGTRYP